MRTIKIGFSRPKSGFKPFSWLIRWYLSTEYSHTYLDFYSKELNRSIIYEATKNGVRFVGQKQWLDHVFVVSEFEIELTQEEYKKIITYCIDHSGIPYSLWQNIGICIANFLKLKKNPFGKKGSNCSEEIGKILELKGYKFNKDLNLLTPKDIYLALNQLSSSPNSQCSRSDT
jgi:hypothetical protein